MKPRLLLLMGLLLGWGLVPRPAAAQNNLTLEFQAGYDSFYKTGTWVPIQVTVGNQGASLTAALHVRDDSTGFSASEILYVFPVQLPSQSRQQLTLYLPLRGQRQLQLDLVDGEDNLLISRQRRVDPLDTRVFLAGIIARDPSLLNSLANLRTSDAQRVAVAHLRLGDLPANPAAWSGLDMLVFNDVDTATLKPGQQAALRTWVSFGGQLVVGGGPNAARTIAGLAPLLPVSDVTVVTLSHPIGALKPFESVPLEDRGPYVAAVPVQTVGRLLVQEGELPLIVSQEINQGRVYYLALDLALAPLDALGDQPTFFPQLIGQFQPQDGHFSDRANWRDMRNSLAIIPDQTLPTPWTIVLYLVVYILVMGPLNYLVLRLFKRREWAWFSIPVIILIFSSYGYLSGFRLRGGRPLLRQITVIQSEIAAPLAEVDSFIGVYSPFRASYELRFEHPLLVESLYDPFGVNNVLVVTSGETTRVENLRSDIGGIPAVVSHSFSSAPQITTNLDYLQVEGRIQGTIRNDTGLVLDEAWLVVDNDLNNLYVVQLDSVPPGETAVDRPVISLRVEGSLYDSQRINDRTPEGLQLASRDIALRTMMGLAPGSGVRKPFISSHLVAWQIGSPVRLTLAGERADSLSETLYLIGVPLALQ